MAGHVSNCNSQMIMLLVQLTITLFIAGILSDKLEGEESPLGALAFLVQGLSTPSKKRFWVDSIRLSAISIEADSLQRHKFKKRV